MYLIFGVIGLVIGGFSVGSSFAMFIGFVLGIVVCGLCHISPRANNKSSVFDGCIILLILEIVFSGLGEL